MADRLAQSWGAFTSERAAQYLCGFGHPAESSKQLLTEVIAEQVKGRPATLLDIGCGNAHIYRYFREQGLDCVYTGVDFSRPLLEAAQEAYGGAPEFTLIEDDVSDLSKVEGPFDVAFYSHTLEMLESPERSLHAAKRLADKIAIRFFEAPEHDVDSVELKTMDVGGAEPVPYLRRSMSRDYYRMILGHIGCRSVDVYRDDESTDQVHVLHFA